MAVTKVSSAFSRSSRKARMAARGRRSSIRAKRIRCRPRSEPTVAGTTGWRSQSTWAAWPASVTWYMRWARRPVEIFSALSRPRASSRRSAGYSAPGLGW